LSAFKFDTKTATDDFFVAEDDPHAGGRHQPHAGMRIRPEEREFNHEQLADIANRFKQRGHAATFTGDMDSVPQRLLLPSVNDANLWQVRVKVSLHCVC